MIKWKKTFVRLTNWPKDGWTCCFFSWGHSIVVDRWAGSFQLHTLTQPMLTYTHNHNCAASCVFHNFDQIIADGWKNRPSYRQSLLKSCKFKTKHGRIQGQCWRGSLEHLGWSSRPKKLKNAKCNNSSKDRTWSAVPVALLYCCFKIVRWGAQRSHKGEYRISRGSTDFRPVRTGLGFEPFGGIWIIRLWFEPGYRGFVL